MYPISKIFFGSWWNELLGNDHIEGNLRKFWQEKGSIQLSMVGICLNGTSVESARETIWYDVRHPHIYFDFGYKLCGQIRAA